MWLLTAEGGNEEQHVGTPGSLLSALWTFINGGVILMLTNSCIYLLPVDLTRY